MQPLCGKGGLKCICLEMHPNVQALLWSAVVSESTVMQQPPFKTHKRNTRNVSKLVIYELLILWSYCMPGHLGIFISNLSSSQYSVLQYCIPLSLFFSFSLSIYIAKYFLQLRYSERKTQRKKEEKIVNYGES